MNTCNHQILPRATGRLVQTFLLSVVVISLAGCSIKRMAVNKIGNALAGSGTTFAADNDPELIKPAVPFSLKLMEGLLDENPRHAGLLLATASGFTQYSFAFVQQDADELEATNFAAAQAMRRRAGKLYLRARNYALIGLEVAHPGFTNALQSNPPAAAKLLKPKDVPLAYWCAVSTCAAISVSKDTPDLIADLPQAEALIDRALELDESFDRGAIHAFLITYEMSRQGAPGDPAARARKHFDRAVELSGGKMAGPFVSWAEAVSVQKQDYAEFKAQLERALAINADAQPDCRLANLIMQHRANWLLAHAEDLFVPKNWSIREPQEK
jgi:predicted anti-sigma-YlaC factor YlaD